MFIFHFSFQICHTLWRLITIATLCGNVNTYSKIFTTICGIEVLMSNQTDHTIVRLRVPPELKKQIEDAAEQNNRSQSAEMVDRLEKSFSEQLSQNDQLDIFINVLEKLVPGMEVNSTSSFLVELINARKKQQSSS